MKLNFYGTLICILPVFGANALASSASRPKTIVSCSDDRILAADSGRFSSVIYRENGRVAANVLKVVATNLSMSQGIFDLPVNFNLLYPQANTRNFAITKIGQTAPNRYSVNVTANLESDRLSNETFSCLIVGR